MSFSDFWKNLFGGKEPDKKTEKEPLSQDSQQDDAEEDFEYDENLEYVDEEEFWNAEYEAKRAQEQQEENEKRAVPVKEWLINTLKEKNAIDFTWQSGSDEGFIFFDEQAYAAQPKEYDKLEEYLFYILEIGSAGEFEMTGSGSIYVAENNVHIKHESTLREFYDYNPETDEIAYGDKITTDSGDFIIFPMQS